MDKTAFRSLTYGMYLVSSLRDGKPVGCVANTFTQVTSSPAQESIALNKDNFTTQGVRETGAFEVTVLDQSASMELIGGEEPMTYAYYHQVKGGKTPPKAPSFNEDAPAKKEESDPAAGRTFAWRCTVCGHIEYVDELPEDFVCPICGVGRDLFERIEL